MALFPATRPISDPVLNKGDEPYFAAAAENRLLIKKCANCNKVHHFPRTLCPFCWSDDVQWIEAAGTGTVYTFSITRRGVGAPYCIAYVSLDEGPTMLTNIIDTDLEQLSIGQQVKVAFQRSEGGVAIPMFTPMDR